jgi:hypothetical protein
MTTSLLTDNAWGRITKLARQTSSAKVAVAYFGRGAASCCP